MESEIIFKELSTENDFDDCVFLQKKIFGLDDKDTLPSMFIKLLTRQYPKIGYAIGAFTIEKSKQTLIGYLLANSSTLNNSIYGMAIGIITEYNKKKIGEGLFKYLKQTAKNDGATDFYGIYDPLEGNLANLYINKMNMRGIKYEPSTECIESSIPNDKLLLKWDFNSNEKRNFLINSIYLENNGTENAIPFDGTKILIEIPAEFKKLKKANNADALKWRLQTRKLLSYYINENNYSIVGFHSDKTKSKRRNYYILENQL